MIDRLELFTSRRPTIHLEKKLSGRVGTPSIREKENGLIPLDRVSITSKLVREDEEIKELRASETNTLYRRVLVERVVADAKEQEAFDDPVQFIVMAYPRFGRQQRDTFKIVCNPSSITLSRLLAFLKANWPDGGYKSDSTDYLEDFRLGRVDFAIDVETHSVDQLFQMAFVDRNLRKHTNVYDHTPAREEGDGFVRTISGLRLETVYVGKGRYVLRIYDKKREAEHQIQVCRAQGWPIPDHLTERAALPQLSRIEMQVRDLGRTGYREEIDKKTGEVKRVWDPKRGHHHLRTLADLLNMERKHMDIFADVQFRPFKECAPFEREVWKAPAFNALAKEVGFDQAVRMLPPDTRKRFKAKLRDVTFPMNCDEEQFEEIRRWIAA